MDNENKREHVNIVIVGHVDHGKSTVIGRLLADTGALPQGKLEAVREKCRKTSKPFEYAFLLDALKDEQEQGITIDAARCFFKSKKRDYIIIDAPGHIEFLRNMVTGASRAEAALLVIDAKEGIKENSKRHGYLLSMLGIKKIGVLVNKMDLVDYKQEVYDDLVESYTKYLATIGIEPLAFLPISAFHGENLIKGSSKMPWYKGQDVLGLLDGLALSKEQEGMAFRMPVQGVYKFTKGGDDRRIIAGTVEYGKIEVGDEVVFYPSGKRSYVKSLEGFMSPPANIAEEGQAIGFTLQDQLYVKRGDVACISKDAHEPINSSHIRANVFWLGNKPLAKEKTYFLKIGTAKVRAQVLEVVRVLNASDLNHHDGSEINKHEVGEVIIKTFEPVAFDLAHTLQKTSRLVIVDGYEIAGGGIILSEEEENKAAINHRIEKNAHWQASDITRTERMERLSQKPTLILISGPYHVGKKTFGKALERKLFNLGRLSYFMTYGNMKHSLNEREKDAGLMAFGEMSNLLLELGTLVIATLRDATREDLETLKVLVEDFDILSVYIGSTKDPYYDLNFDPDPSDEALDRVIYTLKDRQVIFHGGHI